MTGHLRQRLGVKPFYLNLRYTRDLQACLRWLNGRTTLPLPYLFAGLDRARDLSRAAGPVAAVADPADVDDNWQQVYRGLWNKTVTIHQKRRR